MIDRRRLAYHGRGLVLLFAVLFLGLSLAGYDPTDPPGSASWRSQPSAPHNPCGPIGALLAHGLQSLFGASSWLVLYALMVLDLLVFRRRLVAEVPIRLLGFGFLLAVLAATIQLLAPDLPGHPPVGSGGYLGSVLATILSGRLARSA